MLSIYENLVYYRGQHHKPVERKNAIGKSKNIAGFLSHGIYKGKNLNVNSKTTS